MDEIELHDSELIRVDLGEGTLLINAYVHRSGADIRGEGGYQHVLFRFQNLQSNSRNQIFFGDIYAGSLHAANLNPDDLIPLPLKINGPVKLAVTLRDDGREATFLGDGLAIEQAGPYRFVEWQY